jgi:hypothetical protein
MQYSFTGLIKWLFLLIATFNASLLGSVVVLILKEILIPTVMTIYLEQSDISFPVITPTEHAYYIKEFSISHGNFAGPALTVTIAL